MQWKLTPLTQGKDKDQPDWVDNYAATCLKVMMTSSYK